MKLEQLTLTAFRGIRDISIPFQGKTTILYGVNGVGKSSILNAIDILFARLISKVSTYRPQLNLSLTDIQYGCSSASISGTFLFDDDRKIEYSRRIVREGGRFHASKTLDEFADHFAELYFSEGSSADPMPIFVNYGVNRSVLDIPLRISTKHSFERQAAFENAIQNKIDFRVFFEWFRNQEDIENEEKISRHDFTYKDRSLTAVRTAAVAMLEGVQDLRIMRKPLRMSVTKGNKSLRIEQLSDGEKCTIALFGDLARRLALANPNVDNPLEGGGIVLIDEVDLHMHPAWQRTVMARLHETFPNIQFIVTTHSPQILGEHDPDFNIFNIHSDENGQICFNAVDVGYYDSNLVLEDLMGVAYVNPRIKELEQRISHSLMEKNFNRALEDLESLRKLTKDTDPFITQVQMMLRKMKQ